MSEEDALKENLLGNNAYDKRDFSKAISHYEKAISLNPREMSYHSSRAAVYFETKELEKCVRCCETALEVGREKSADSELMEKVMRRLGSAHRKMGNLQEAMAVLKKAVAEYETLEAKVALCQVEKKIKQKAKENCEGDTKDEANSSKKRSFAEMLAELGPKIFSSKSDSTSEDDSDFSEDENVIKFKVLGGGSCSECNCGNAKNMEIPTTGFGSRDDPIPFVDLRDVERAVSMMLDVDEMVVPEDRKSISVVFDYPLKDKFVFELESPRGKGFTRGELATAIATKYREIYQEEEETSSLPVETMSERSARLGGASCNLINRAKTEGKYGIWGHELGDLALDQVTFCPKDNRYYLGISS